MHTEVRGTASKWIVALMVAMSLAGGCRSVTGRSAGQYVDDKTITAQVKTKLTADKVSNLTRVSVRTTNGTVYLTGVVDSPEQKQRAEDVASRVNGVKQVVSNLEVSQATGK